MLFPLSILFGILVGFALGLTGGGGSRLAVPPLVYGLGGVIGMSLGGLVSKRLPVAVLQKVFAIGIVAVAIFIVSKTLV